MSEHQRQIVSAAIKLKDGRVICGVRHFDELMRMAIEGFANDDMNLARELIGRCEQGFVDNRYQFLDRNEAWKVAEAAGQTKGTPSCPGFLFSEDLW